MTLRKGLPAKLANTDAGDTRYDFRNFVVCNADGTARSGVTSPVGAVLSATATMNVNVSAFSGVAARDGGVVALSSDGPVSVLLDAAPSANSRIDVITARQNDSSSTVSVPDANDTPVFIVIKGTAAATPVRPTVPDGSLDLGSVLIPSTATATNSAGVVITTPPQFTASAGGVVPFNSTVDRDAWSNPKDSQLGYLLNAGQLIGYVASATTPGWYPVGGRPVSGTLAYTGIYSASGTSVPTLTMQGGRVYLDGVVTSSSANFVAGTTYTIGSVPSSFAPSSEQQFACRTANGTAVAFVAVQTSGAVLFALTAGFTGSISLSLGGCNWRQKGL